MLSEKWVKFGLVTVSLFTLLFYVLEIDAFARAGGSKSSGSRGSRSYSAPSSPAKSATSPSRQVAPAPAPGMSQPQSGGFMRNMMGGLAGGILGGMIGGMLFRNTGMAGASGVGGSGIGLFEIILIGAILYGIWWFIKKKRQEAAVTAGPAYYREASQPRQPIAYGSATPAPAYSNPQPAENDLDDSLAHIRQMDPAFDEQQFKDQGMDNFFKVQGAWASRDLTTIRTSLTDEMFGILQKDADDLKLRKQINRLENIAVRTVEITEGWQEAGKDFITVRFCANLLDYTVDEASGQVLAGSKTDPVKFDEYWTFTRSVGNNPWQLSAINQA
ncbi:MAG TPA: Tim44 domain-containing protein [Syntrophus sp. (in: bacteria)]|jgi:predicted lipid-binding transport protein (Tim44 family)|nr:Tim44 domain-containing protein [Syntrophus sp. (in: bacteria)]